MRTLLRNAASYGWGISTVNCHGIPRKGLPSILGGMSWLELFVYACGYAAAFLWFYREYVGLLTTAAGSTFLTLAVVFGWWPF